MKKPRKILKRNQSLHLVGFRPGEFIRLYQGTPSNPIKHRWMVEPNGPECFEVFDEEPRCVWGSGVYRVRDDNTLQKIASDYDSSD
jgi:hypothetical protein